MNSFLRRSNCERESFSVLKEARILFLEIIDDANIIENLITLIRLQFGLNLHLTLLLANLPTIIVRQEPDFVDSSRERVDLMHKVTVLRTMVHRNQYSLN
jgi:ParB-like chromosome segregation protein Spo0J